MTKFDVIKNKNGTHNFVIGAGGWDYYVDIDTFEYYLHKAVVADVYRLIDDCETAAIMIEKVENECFDGITKVFYGDLDDDDIARLEEMA